MKDLLVILGILILGFELYRLLRGNWIQCFLKKKKWTGHPPKPRVMKAKSERDCPFCVKENGGANRLNRECQNHGVYGKGEEGPRNDTPQVDTYVPTQIVNISGSSMKESRPWLDTAANASMSRFEI